MNPEKIKVRVTDSGQTLDVVVLSKRADRIEVVLGEGVHSVRCALTPTRTGVGVGCARAPRSDAIPQATSLSQNWHRRATTAADPRMSGEVRLPLGRHRSVA